MPTPQEILQQYWGYSSFRGKQLAIIDKVLAGQDVLALLPTGGGKSVCFQVPALLMEGVCLVISPLIALMKDQVQNLEKKNIKATALFSGMTYHEVKKTLKQVAADEYKFLYVSPERLESDLFVDFLPQLNITLIAVDEAHCISQWGYDFRPPYLRIAKLKKELPSTPFIALTASATPLVQADIIEKLQFKESNVFLQSFEKPNLSYSVFKCDSKINKAIEILQKVAGSSIVYCSNRKQTKEVAILLQQHGFSADFYHAGLTQAERNNKQQAWINNQLRIMVCTNAFGMGIDKPDVRTVIHLQLTDCLENYYQEAGRAGRDGKRAFAVLLYEPADVELLKNLAEIRFPSFDIIKEVYQNIADYLQIPVGIGEGNYYDFDVKEFATNFKVDIQLTLNVLKMLAQQGHISFTENVYIPSKVIFTADKKTVNEVEQTHPQLDEVMKCLLRTYQGIYEHWVAINEKLIARLIKKPLETVIAQLKILHGYGIIEYVPQKETPQIYFLLNRAPAKYLQLHLDIYLSRKKIFIERTEAMLQYVVKEKDCRSKLLSAYFGDNNVKECGICDNCLHKKKSLVSTQDFSAIQTAIHEMLHKNPLSILQITQQLFQYHKKNVQIVVDYLLSENILTMNKAGQIELQEQT